MDKDPNNIVSDHFVTVKESDGSTEIKQNLSVFGSEVLATKFPNAYDGLKDVQRRIVWNSKDYKDPKSMNQFIGVVSGYHTGGDSSIFGATIRLAQNFMVGYPLVSVNGNSGKYYDPGSFADSRYLEISISIFSRDVYFTDVNTKTIPMKLSDTFNGVEPSHLIPRLPMGLILGNLTVGFGFKSLIPMIDVSQVCSLVMLFADHYKNKGLLFPDKTKMAPCLIPSFPIRNLILNREELLTEYRKGNYECPIKLDGWVELSGNSITLRAVPYGFDFNTAVTTLRAELQNSKSKYNELIDAANQYSADEADFNISIKRGKNPFEVLSKLRGILRLHTVWNPLYNYTLNGKVVCLTPEKLTYNWYKERALSIASSLKYRLAEFINKKLLLTAILIVINHIDEVVDIIRNSETEEAAIKILHEKWQELTLKQSQQLCRQPLNILSRRNAATVERELEQVEIDIKNTYDAFGKINDIIYHDAEILKKKYASTSLTKYSDEFIGYVKFGNWGVINFFSEDDLVDILNSKGWPSSIKKTIHYYDSRYPLKFIVKDNRVRPLTELSKEIWCEDLICYPSTNDELTLVISEDGGTSVMETSIIQTVQGYTLCPITRTFYAIHKNGSITEEHVDSFSKRKSVSRGAKSDLVYGLPNKTKDLVVFHMNDKDPNTLRIDRILTNEGLGSIKFVPVGERYILGIYPIKTKDIILNIPEKCRKSSSMEYLKIHDVKSLFKDRNNNLMFSISKTAKDVKFIRDKRVKSMYTLQF